MNPDLHYVTDGRRTGEVVLFSGSLGSDLSMWEPQVAPLLEAGYRVMRYDHRGHGASPVPPGPYSMADLGSDTLALMDRVGVDRVHVVGLSLGGMLGMWLGGHAPDRIASLTLCCTSADLGPRAMWAERARLVRAEGTGAVADAGVERWFTSEWRTAHPDRTRRFREMIAGTAAEGYASCCAAIETMDLVGGLASITAPTLVIAGARDPATPPEHGQRIVDGIADARLEVVNQAAHLGNVEQPERFNELILDHLKGLT